MKKLSKTEIKNKLIKYFNKKGVELVEDRNDLIWLYNIHYSTYKVELCFR